jgi:predicted DsbA family dithiol-disulfide isomerase
LAQVLPPALMRKVRELVRSDPKLDDSVAADMEMVRHDQINQTPTIVIVSKGTRQKIAPIPPYSVLKSYLDQVLQQQ